MQKVDSNNESTPKTSDLIQETTNSNVEDSRSVNSDSLLLSPETIDEEDGKEDAEKLEEFSALIDNRSKTPSPNHDCDSTNKEIETSQNKENGDDVKNIYATIITKASSDPVEETTSIKKGILTNNNADTKKELIYATVFPKNDNVSEEVKNETEEESRHYTIPIKKQKSNVYVNMNPKEFPRQGSICSESSSVIKIEEHQLSINSQEDRKSITSKITECFTSLISDGKQVNIPDKQIPVSGPSVLPSSLKRIQRVGSNIYKQIEDEPNSEQEHTTSSYSFGTSIQSPASRIVPPLGSVPNAFRSPGVVSGLVRSDSPIYLVKGSLPIEVIPRVPSLARVSTYGSGLNQVSGGSCGRQDSTISRNRARYAGAGTRKIRRRAVFKNGECNIVQSRIARHRLRFLQDIFTTLVDTQWRWTLLVFGLSFVGSWFAFALIWWLIAFTHGDLDTNHLPPAQEDNNWTPCVSQIYSFTSCFLFSIETQHTIGYGSRSTTEECPEAIFIMCLQSIAGVMIQAFMVGIVFAKMTRPKHRTQTLLFSRNAIICQRDKLLCLMFRVGDMRKSHIIGASIRAQLIRSKTTKEGEVLNQYQTELDVSADGCNGDLFFIWPMTIVHKIDETSPLHSLSASDVLQDRFEIVVVLEGTIESTGQTTQARSSYLSSEVLWGYRFDPVVSYNKERQGYEVDYSSFDSITQVDTPLCSGKELAEFYKMQDDYRPVGNMIGLNNERQYEEISEDPQKVLVLQDPPQKRNSVKTDYQTSIKFDENLLRSDESHI